MHHELPVPRLAAVFQPIVELGTGRVIGYEALGRLRRTGRRDLSAGPLLAKAHAEGWLLPLDRALRRAALEAIALAPRAADLLWFLNVDSRVADDPSFTPGFTRRALEELRLPALRVVVELGEHDPKLDRERLGQLFPSYARQGFTIALDDFGRGHASAALVHEIRPDVIKLDRSLVHGSARDADLRARVEAVARLADEVGAAIVAEGIEDDADLRWLASAGVGWGQGFLLGRPAPLPSGSIVSDDPRNAVCDETVTAA